ncbi:MAG: acyltransferase [Bacteroidia bacterium]|nr:acyltransferase [Bacteroidia bacterium]
MKELIVREIEKIKEERGGNIGTLALYAVLGIRFASLGFNWLISRWYLRKATSLGKIVFTQGKPKVINRGTLKIGNVTRVWSSVNQTRLSVGKGAILEIGSDCRINGPTISANNKVIIGNHCRIAPHVIIMDDDFHDVSNRQAGGKGGEIIIKDHAWVATRAMVLKGVTIGRRAVVASGAVVTKDVPDYAVVAGVPAKILRYLTPPPEDEALEILATASSASTAQPSSL